MQVVCNFGNNKMSTNFENIEIRNTTSKYLLGFLLIFPLTLVKKYNLSRVLLPYGLLVIL